MFAATLTSKVGEAARAEPARAAHKTAQPHLFFVSITKGTGKYILCDPHKIETETDLEVFIMATLELTPEQEEAFKALEEYAEVTIEEETKDLQALVDVVNQAVSIQLVKGQVVSNVNLSAFELEALAMRIPAECLRLQAQLNKYNVQNTFRDMRLDAEMTISLSKLLGTKGTVEERKRTAELTVLDERIQNAVNKLIIRGIQGSIERADKVYEGIKKVMDYRSKEGWFDRKGPQ